MANFIKATIIAFKLFLFSLLIFMVVEQFNEYLKNDDVSSLGYKKFLHHKEDIYPVFSLCLFSADGGLFKDALGSQDAKIYFDYLRGEMNASTLKLYEDLYNISNVNYEYLAIDVWGAFDFHNQRIKGMDGKLSRNRSFGLDKTFEISYQDYEQICLTRKEDEGSKHLKMFEQVLGSASWLLTPTTWLNIYVHLKGQFIRSLGNDAAVSSIGQGLFEGNEDLEQPFQYKIYARVHSIDILRKRHDSRMGCNQTSHNDDAQWHQYLVQKLQCLPPFMLYNDETLALHSKLSKCDQEKLREFINYSPPNYFDALAKDYLPPCSQMSSVVTHHERLIKTGQSQTLALKLDYPVEYRETVNQQAYNFYALWSQIGGLVGIIVGYSLMQIPDVIEFLVNELPSHYKKTAKHQNNFIGNVIKA